MKRNVLNVTTLFISITLCILFVGAQNLIAGSSKGFVYNKSKNCETVFLYDSISCTLTPHLKYEFSYDSNGSMKTKVAYKWNSENKWDPYYLYTVSYAENAQIQELAYWDEIKKSFSIDKQKAVIITESDQNLFSYIVYKWNDKRGRWDPINRKYVDSYITLLVDELVK